MRLVLIFFFLASFLRANDRADIGHLIQTAEIRNVLPTGSMEPTLNEKCFLLVKRTPFKELNIGDIILYLRSDGVLIVHRIWGKSSGNTVIICKGDANAGIDREFIYEDMYRGTVIGIIRKDFLEKVDLDLTTPKFKL